MQGYQAQLGVPLTLFHPVRDVDGAYVAGQAASVSKALLGPDRLAAPSELAGVTLTDHAVAGWVQAVFTGTRLGIYTLALTNPSGTDERTEEYPITVLAGVAPSATLLTSLDRVRTRLQLLDTDGTPIQPGDSHPFDALINLLISEVSDEYQAWLGRTFVEQTYTVYLDGTDRNSLVLPAGPLVSVTSLSEVAYSDDGAGGATETLTTVPRSSYVLSGLRNYPGFRGMGRIDLVDRCARFCRGNKNYKAVFVAGFAAVPEAVVGLATEDVVFRLMTRDTGHLLSKSLGDGSISYLRPQQMFEQREARLAPYLLEAA